MNEAVKKLLATALAEEGYLEKKTCSSLDSKTANAGSNNWTKYARDLDNMGDIYNGKKNGYPWCDAFVDWCFITTFGKAKGMELLCQAYKGNGASCTSSAGYYKNKGQFYKSSPQPGDQIFFTSDGGQSSCHTGIVVSVDSNKVYTIEGNTSSTSGVVANGGCVRQKSYALNYSRIYGYGRPKWSLVTTTTTTTTVAATTVSKSEEEEEMTQEKFNEMMDNYLSSLAKQPATWEQSAMNWAQTKGLMIGNDQGELMPKKFITRGELATVLQRLADK